MQLEVLSITIRDKSRKTSSNLSVAMHALSACSWWAVAVSSYKASVSSSSSAVRLNSLISGTDKTARALNKVSTDGLDLMGGALL